MILDEPEAGIDLWSFAKLTETFGEIHKKRDCIMMIISHQERIISLADEIIVISGGRIARRGSTEEIFPTILADTPALIIGWGRIGKCLAKLLSGLGCPVTIAARNPSDRAMARALGWAAVDISGIPPLLSGIGVIFNTVPAPILGKDTLDTHEKCVKIDLASIPGLEGQDVIRARGLPGLYAPESSGGLIAETIARYLREEAK